MTTTRRITQGGRRTRKKRKGTWYVGTSGFMESRQRWLTHPGLSAIEINSTFYRPPSQKLVQSWNLLPKGMVVVIKLWRYITHMKFLKDIDTPLKEFMDSLSPARDRVNVILVQLPPRFVNKPDNVSRIKKLGSLMRDSPYGIAVEFRNKSWLIPETYKMMEEVGMAIVGTVIRKKPDSTKWLGSMPNGSFIPPKTAPFTYTRVHGSKGYRGDYSRTELLELRSSIVERKAKSDFIFFNNVFFDERTAKCKITRTRYAAICNAVEFSRLVS